MEPLTLDEYIAVLVAIRAEFGGSLAVGLLSTEVDCDAESAFESVGPPTVTQVEVLQPDGTRLPGKAVVLALSTQAEAARRAAEWESLLAVVDEAHSDTMRHTRHGGGTNPDEWRAEGAARALGEVLEAMAL